MEQWSMDTPVVVVPTKYPTAPLDDFVDVGISNVIFANQSLRTVVGALQKNLRRLRDTLDLTCVEDQIAPVEEIFRLQNIRELKDAEARYLPIRPDERRRPIPVHPVTERPRVRSARPQAAPAQSSAQVGPTGN